MHALPFRSRNDYFKVAQDWWEVWHGNRIRADILSSYGIVVLDKTGPLALGYLFPPIGSGMCILGWVITNPNVSKFRAGKAIKLLIQAAEDESKLLGYSVLYVQTDSTAVQKVCLSRDYHVGAVVQEFLKGL